MIKAIQKDEASKFYSVLKKIVLMQQRNKDMKVQIENTSINKISVKISRKTQTINDEKSWIHKLSLTWLSMIMCIILIP